jgi:hypothetical protein
MKSDFIPHPDAKFHSWQGNLVGKIDPVAGALGIPEAAMTALHTKKARWDAAYKKADDPATRTKAAVMEKKKARKDYQAYLRDFNNIYLLHNPGLTDADREDFGLPVHKTTRTPAPVAKTYPIGRADTSMLRRIIIHFANQDTSEETSKAKPPGQHGAEIRWALSETPVIDVAELTHSSFDTHTPFTLEFQGHERGKTLYFALCWENTRGEKGPYSPIENAIIP